LTGKGLVLRLNSPSVSSAEVSPPPGAVRFVFPAGLATGSTYALTVQSQPVDPRQQCAVTRGQAVGTIAWNPGRPSTSFAIEFKVDSDATVGAQSGQSSPGAPLKCDAMSHHFQKNTYRLLGELPALMGPARLTCPMPQNDDTAGNLGCPPEGNTCHVQFWFDNSPGTARTSLDLPTLLATGSVVVPIRGTATNVGSDGEKRSGNYRWSGTLTLRIARNAP
jgi:hypothetical protein